MNPLSPFNVLDMVPTVSKKKLKQAKAMFNTASVAVENSNNEVTDSTTSALLGASVSVLAEEEIVADVDSVELQTEVGVSECATAFELLVKHGFTKEAELLKFKPGMRVYQEERVTLLNIRVDSLDAL
jgi:hypothetical protein